MPALAFDALLKSLKQAPPHPPPSPVYYLHGEEQVLKEEAARALVERAVDPASRDFNVDAREAAELDPAVLRSLVDTPPLLADRRAVVLRGVEDLKKKGKTREELLRYLAAPNPSTVLVLVQGEGEPDADLAIKATAVQVDRLSPDRLPRWVMHHAGRIGLEIEPEAATLLVAAVGNDLAALAGELEKLAALTGGRAATPADVASAVGVRRGETVVDLVEAALERRAGDAARLVGPVLDQAGMTGVRIVIALGTALLGTALARAELDRGTPRARLEDVLFRHVQAARPYGLRGWRDEAARFARWASVWTAAGLAHALRRALAADVALKGTRLTDERGIIVQLVLELGVRGREAA
jgi:DNA polymerase III subunit delta